VDEAQELTDAQWQMLLGRCPSRGQVPWRGVWQLTRDPPSCCQAVSAGWFTSGAGSQRVMRDRARTSTPR
jgi:hypothetical protein